MRHPEAAKARRDWVLDRMLEDGYITAAEAAAGQAEPLQLAPRAATEIGRRADYFAEEVRRELIARYGEKALYEGGLRCAPPSIRGCRRSPTRRCATASSPTTAAMAGAARSPRSIRGRRLGRARWPRVPRAGRCLDDWQLAVVLRDRRQDGASIGFADGSDRHDPVRRAALGAAVR